MGEIPMYDVAAAHMTEHRRCVNAESGDNEFLKYGQRLGPLGGRYTMDDTQSVGIEGAEKL